MEPLPEQTEYEATSGDDSSGDATHENRKSLRGAILETVCYAHMFRFPLTVTEIHERLIGRPCGFAEVVEAIKTDPVLQERLSERDGYIFLRGFGSIVERRFRSAEEHDALTATNRVGLRLLTRVPYLRFISFSGGTAHKNSIEEQDIDLFLIARRNRLYIVYAAIILISRLLGRRALYCANYMVDESRLEFENQNLYTATELVHLCALEADPIHQEMLDRNRWVEKFLPNARLRPPVDLWKPSRWELTGQKLTEFLFTPLAWIAEPLLRGFFQKRLERKRRSSDHSNVILEASCLKLHFQDRQHPTLRQFEETLRTGTSTPSR